LPRFRKGRRRKNLVYFIEKIGCDSSRLIYNPKKYEQVSNYLSGGSYFHKLTYSHVPNETNNSENEGSPLVLSDPKGFKSEIEKNCQSGFETH
jgi:hypothetical protein